VSASLLITREAAVRHESGHVAGLHALGISVHSVDVEDRGDRHGFVAHDLRVVDRGSALQQAKHTMCAWLSEGAGIPAWPLNQGPVTSSDEQQLAHIADVLEWDEADYQALIADTHQLMATPRFKNAYEAVHGALQSTDRLHEQTLHRLLEPRLEHKVLGTRWVLPETAFDRMGAQILADRDAAIRRARAAQAAARHNSAAYKSARADTLALVEAERAKRVRQRMAHDLDLLTRSRVA
jgi:hypothetical protein